MSEQEYYIAFRALLEKVKDFPQNLDEIKRQTSMLITAEKWRRIDAMSMAGRICIMEENDYNKLSSITEINAISWREEILKGVKFTRSIKSVKPFVCEKCWIKHDIQGIHDRVSAKKDEQERQKKEYQRQRDQEKYNNVILHINSKGREGYATASQAYWALKDRITAADYESLSRMEYKAFLGTPYWFVVRNFVLQKNGYQCSLCAKKHNLHVHHKHYRNRGKELLTWKDDLIVLCSNCHAKQHDKLERSEDQHIQGTF